MELRRCTFHDRRYRLAEHIKKGKHSFDRPRCQDKEFPPSFVVDNKIESKEQLQMVITRALAILAGSLNISTNKVTSKQMESFIRFILGLGIQIHTNFPQNTLNPKDIFNIFYAKAFNDYLRLTSEEIHKNSIELLKNKYVNLEIDSGTVKKLNVIHYIVSVVDDPYIKPYLLKLQKNNHSDFTDYCAYTRECVNLLLDNNI